MYCSMNSSRRGSLTVSLSGRSSRAMPIFHLDGIASCILSINNFEEVVWEFMTHLLISVFWHRALNVPTSRKMATPSGVPSFPV